MPKRSRRLATLSATTTVWSPRQAIPGTSKARDQIDSVMDSKGKQWAVWRDSSSGNFDLWYSKRRLKRAWHPAAMIEGTRANLNFALAAAPEGRVLLTWNDASNPKRIGYLEFLNKPGKAIFLPNDSGLSDQFPQVAASADGTRYLVWTRGTKIFFAASSDGKSWNISPLTLRDGFTAPAVAVDDTTQTLHVAYISSGGDGTIFYQATPLQTPAWSAPKSLGRGKDLALEARDGKLMLCWGNDLDANRQVAVRVLQGGRWSATTHPPGVSVSGFQPHGVIDSRGDMHLIWSQFVAPVEQYKLYFSDFTDGAWADAQPYDMPQTKNVGNDLVIDSADGLHAVHVVASVLDAPYYWDRIPNA